MDVETREMENAYVCYDSSEEEEEFQERIMWSRIYANGPIKPYQFEPKVGDPSPPPHECDYDCGSECYSTDEEDDDFDKYFDLDGAKPDEGRLKNTSW